MILKENDTGRQRTTEPNDAVERQQTAAKKERSAKMTIGRAMRQNLLRHEVSQIAPAKDFESPLYPAHSWTADQYRHEINFA